MSRGRNDEFERSIAVGERALGCIKTHRTSANPRGYDVWFNYVSGYVPALKTAMDQRLAVGAVTAEDVENLYEEHLSPLRYSERMEQVGTGLVSEADQIIAMLQENLGDSASFGAVLDGAASKLTSQNGSVVDLRVLVEELVRATRQMELSNRELEGKLVASQHEILGLHSKLNAIRTESLADPLTTLANRRSFDATLRASVVRAQAFGEPLALLMADIDHFKRFNDTFGHLTGDQVLRLVAQALKLSIKGADLAARYGGEEFAIILPQTRLDGARALGEQIRQTVMSKELVKRSTGENLGKVTISVGVACYRPGDDPGILIERADRCLYAAKRAGRNRVVDESMDGAGMDPAAP